jgi:serine/threonine-protein kinase
MTHDGASETIPPPSLGPYLLGRQIGRGGMGLVYEATHRESGQRVAIKSLSPQLATSEGFRERFEAEIASLETLRHQGIVRLFGYGEEGGTLYYAMELVEGTSLEEELRRGRRFHWREATQIAIQVSRALKHAHDHGVVHRDIKPANILLDPRGQTKLADFGIARLFGATGVTIAGGVLGTADYMSPEQAAGKPVTSRCDQYSLGGLMYTLIAGRPPFRADNLPAMLQLQRYAVPEPLRRYAPDIPAELERIVGQLLEKDPAARFPNTLVLARRLEAMLHGLSRPPADDDFVVGDQRGQTELDREAMSALDSHLGETRQAAGVLGESISLPGVSEAATPAAPMDVAQAPPRSRPVRYKAVEAISDVAPPPWRAAIGPAILLVAALVGLGAVLWLGTAPLSADALFERVAENHQRGDSDGRARDAVAEFLRRFPEDPRCEEVRLWGDDLRTRALEKQLLLGRLAGRARGGTKSVEELLHARANAIADQGAAEGAEAFRRLADLLEAAPAAGEGSAGAAAKQRRLYAELARREALRQATAEVSQSKLLVAFCEERLADARRVASDDPAGARAIADGLLRLVPRTAATAAALDDARDLADSLPAPPD